MSRNSDQTAAGCMGVGCLGLLVVVLVGMCSGGGGGSSNPTPRAAPTPTPVVRETFFIHDDLNVRSAPTASAPRIRTLRRGDRVELGPKDANGWARLYGAGSTEEYVYRASDRVRTERPSHAPSATASRRTSAADRGYYTGPRGGCYTYSSSGRKRYVDPSYCY